MKARYLGIIFVAAVLVPSVFLSVLSIRSAGREEAYVEKQLATTLLAEVTHTAGLLNAGVAGLAEELHASVSLPPGAAYHDVLPAWKKRNPLVGVPYLLSSSYQILWPPAKTSSDVERMFLQQNSDFLSGRSGTAVYANIAVVHKEEVFAESGKLDQSMKKPSTEKLRDASAGASAAPAAAPPTAGSAAGSASAPPAQPAQPRATPSARPSTAKPSTQARTPQKVIEYWIQTGSYKSQPMAEQLAALLGGKGLSGRVFSLTSHNETFYRVRIGPYANKGDAEKFLAIVKQVQGLESSYISQVPTTKSSVN